jgi:hypothetical protein
LHQTTHRFDRDRSATLFSTQGDRVDQVASATKVAEARVRQTPVVDLIDRVEAPETPASAELRALNGNR